MFQRFAPRLAAVVGRGRWVAWLGWKLMRAQARAAASRGHARQRRQQVLADEQFDKAMGFAGRE